MIRRRGPGRSQAARLFGYDLFISFALGAPPRGSRNYASDLARKLRERDFTVFFSEDEAPAGGELDNTLKRALRRSRVLVVIANGATLADPRWVRAEVEEFRRAHPSRSVVPVNVGGALQDPDLGRRASEWLPFRDKIWIDETAEAGAAGIVSDGVVERLITTPTAVRSATRLRQLVVGLLVFFAVLAGAALHQRNEAIEQRDTALARQLSVHAQRAQPAELAVLLAIESIRLRPFPETESLLREKLRTLPVAAGTLPLSGVRSNALLPVWSFSPRGTYFAVAITGGHVEVFDVSSGKPVLRVEEESATRVVFSTDELQLAIANSSRQVILHHLANGTSSRVLDGLGEISSMSFSPDGSKLAVGLWTNYPFGRQRNGYVVLDAATGEVLREERTDDGAGQLQFSADGSALAIQVRNSLLLQRVEDLPGQPATIHSDVKQWAFGAAGEELLILDRGGKLHPRGFSGQDGGSWNLDGLQSFALSADGALLAAGRGTVVDVVGRDGLLKSQFPIDDGALTTLGFRAGHRKLLVNQTLFDVSERRPLVRLEARPIAFSPDGALVASYESVAEDAGRIQFWHADGGEVVVRMKHDGPVCTVSFSRDGKRLVTASADGTARVWAVPDGRELARSRHAEGVTAAWWAPDERTLVSAGSGNAAWWRLSDSAPLASLKYRPEISPYFNTVLGCRGRRTALSAAWHKGEPLLAVAESNKHVAVWSVRRGERLSTIEHAADHDPLSNDDALTVLLNADATILATANRSELRALLAWRPQDGTLLQTFSGATFAFRLAFTDKGELLAWPLRGRAGAPAHADVWSLRNGQTVRRSGSPVVASENLGISADRRRTVERTDNGLLVRDTARAGYAAPIAQEAPINDFALSPDGRYVATAGGDGTVRLLFAATDDVVRDACRRLARNLTREQWNRYAGIGAWHETCPGLISEPPAQAARVSSCCSQQRTSMIASSASPFWAISMWPSMKKPTGLSAWSASGACACN